MAQTATPIMSPVGGTFISEVEVTITCATPASTIYYTVDGTVPTVPPSGTEITYTIPFTVDTSLTVKAIADTATDDPSNVASETYTIQVATPVLNPTTGNHTAGFSVTMSCTTPGTTIRYTDDGITEPTGASTEYTVPVALAATTTLKAKGFKAGLTDSATATEVYTFGTAPTISVDPISDVVQVGDAASFVVTAAGTAPLHYQWRKSTVPVGTDSNTYSIPVVALSHAGTYDVIVSNGFSPDATSAEATLHISPSITTQPASQEVGAHSTVTFTVVATGEPVLLYQWWKDSVILGGENNASLVLANVVDTNQGLYSVVVTNVYGTVTSADAELIVDTAPVITLPPQNAAGEYHQQLMLQVTAVGDADVPLVYQWKKDGTNIGTNSASYVIPDLSTADLGYYTVTVTNTYGTVTSAPTRVTMLSAADAMEEDYRRCVEYLYRDARDHVITIRGILASKGVVL
jgi:hypothetical protein